MTQQFEEPPIDFSSPEDVIFEVLEDGSVESETILNQTNPAVIGAASYEKIYGGFLDYTIEGLLEHKEPGWHVMEGVTGIYRRGDGYTTDDDMDFYFETVRPATLAEVEAVI